MTNHKHYEVARRAYYWSSFSPDKRAESECRFFDEINAEFDALGVDEAGKAKFERLFVLSLSAKSRCASSMITGPAKFNVEKNRRANEREKKVSDELLAYIERVRKAIDKQNHPEKYAFDAIRSDDENADERSLKAVDVAIAFGESRATREELEAAAAAATAFAYTADYDAAAYAAVAAAAAASTYVTAYAAVAAYTAATNKKQDVYPFNIRGLICKFSERSIIFFKKQFRKILCLKNAGMFLLDGLLLHLELLFGEVLEEELCGS